MKPPASPRFLFAIRRAPLVLLLPALSAACGGTVFTSPDGGTSNDGGVAGAGGTAGSGAGKGGAGGNGPGGAGGGGVGGTLGGAGGSFGGIGGAGGDFAGSGGAAGAGAFGGSGGSGGGGPAACSLPIQSGPCDAYVPSWWHNPSTGVCEPFIYGGCEGNENRFASREACLDACHGLGPDYDACMSPTDCQLVPAGCCGGCEPVDARTFVAINGQAVSKYQGVGRCGLVDCAACPAPQPGVATSQYFVPTCRSGQCTVVDIRETPLTGCMLDSDCVLRFGANCCEGCGGELVALNKNENTDLANLVCGSPVSCPACFPMIPPGNSTSCVSGRCTVNAAACTAEHPCPL